MTAGVAILMGYGGGRGGVMVWRQTDPQSSLARQSSQLVSREFSETACLKNKQKKMVECNGERQLIIHHPPTYTPL